jgi:hypothetical protein
MTRSVPTAIELRRQARRLDRRGIHVGRVLSELRRGAVLQLSYEPRRLWRLSSGAFVTDNVAKIIIGLPCVEGVGDTLFAGGLSQTWRFIDGGDNG